MVECLQRHGLTPWVPHSKSLRFTLIVTHQSKRATSPDQHPHTDRNPCLETYAYDKLPYGSSSDQAFKPTGTTIHDPFPTSQLAVRKSKPGIWSQGSTHDTWRAVGSRSRDIIDLVHVAMAVWMEKETGAGVSVAVESGTHYRRGGG